MVCLEVGDNHLTGGINKTIYLLVCMHWCVCVYMYLHHVSPPTGPTDPLPTQGGTELGGMLV